MATAVAVPKLEAQDLASLGAEPMQGPSTAKTAGPGTAAQPQAPAAPNPTLAPSPSMLMRVPPPATADEDALQRGVGKEAVRAAAARGEFVFTNRAELSLPQPVDALLRQHLEFLYSTGNNIGAGCGRKVQQKRS